MKVVVTLLLIIGLSMLAVGIFLKGREQPSPAPPVVPAPPTSTPHAPTPPVPSVAEQERSAKAVRNWLKAHNYQVEKEGNRYILTGNGERHVILYSAMFASGDIFITTDGNGNLQVGINDVGTAIFKIDTFGNLQAVIKR